MSIDPGQVRLAKSPSGGRYSYPFDDGSAAELDFIEQGPGVVAITHTETPPQHRGQGIAAVLVRRAVQDFQAAGQKVIPACGFAREQFREHEEWSDLLFRRDGGEHG